MGSSGPGEPFGFAGLWDVWKGGKPPLTCCLLTTTANERVSEVHDRMPVIIAPEHDATWLDPEIHLNELERYAMLRVQQLSRGEQNPTVGRPPNIKPFPIAKP